MLTLSRRLGESIIISASEKADPNMTLGELFANGPAVLHIERLRKGEVRLRFDAPLELRIMRDELIG